MLAAAAASVSGVREDLDDLGGGDRGTKFFANFFLAEQRGELGEELQMPVGAVFGDQQSDHDVDLFAVGGVKIDAGSQLQKRCNRLGDLRATPMGDRDTVAQCG